MHNLFVILIFAGLLFASGFNFLADNSVDYSYTLTPSAQGPVRIKNNSLGMKTTAETILIRDDASGSLIYQKNKEAVLPIASITKLMTALLILDSGLDWQSEVVIQESDLRAGGIIRVEAGETATVENLFNLMLVASANEAAAALSRISGLEDFASAMNRKAGALGMNDSNFADSTGLDMDNRSTPSDLLKLADEAFGQEKIVQALQRSDYSFKTLDSKRLVEVKSTNNLLGSFINRDGYQVIGAKTGYLDEAGYCFLLRIRNSQDISLTLAILGSDSESDRWQEAKGLVDWVFRNYLWDKQL